MKKLLFVFFLCSAFQLNCNREQSSKASRNGPKLSSLCSFTPLSRWLAYQQGFKLTDAITAICICL